MELEFTLSLFVVAAALAVLFGWLGARPWKIVTGPRMAPYRFLMLLCGTAAVFAALHVLTLLGFRPGPR